MFQIKMKEEETFLCSEFSKQTKWIWTQKTGIGRQVEGCGCEERNKNPGWAGIGTGQKF